MTKSMDISVMSTNGAKKLGSTFQRDMDLKRLRKGEEIITPIKK